MGFSLSCICPRLVQVLEELNHPNEKKHMFLHLEKASNNRTSNTDKVASEAFFAFMLFASLLRVSHYISRQTTPGTI